MCGLQRAQVKRCCWMRVDDFAYVDVRPEDNAICEGIKVYCVADDSAAVCQSEFVGGADIMRKCSRTELATLLSGQ